MIIFINGKFTSQRTTGVQRLAAELVLALDKLLERTGTTVHWVLLCPQIPIGLQLNVIEIRKVRSFGAGLHLWEQLFLPFYTTGSTLLSLAGSAPIFKLNQVCMIPDAAVYDCKTAYTRLFGMWYRVLFRTLTVTAKGLLTISEFSRGRLIDVLGNRAQRLKIVCCAATHLNFIDPDDSVIDSFKMRGKRFFLAVGSRNPTKNLSALIAAFSELEDNDVFLLLVGGSNGYVFTSESTEPKFDPRVIHTGGVTDAQLVSLYQHATAFVFPSLYEGFGIPPLEAMALDCPVIASRAASVPEICGEAVFYVDPHSVNNIASALRKVLVNQDLRERLKSLGKQHARHFTWDRAANQLINNLISDGVITDSSVRLIGDTHG